MWESHKINKRLPEMRIGVWGFKRKIGGANVW